MPRDNTKKRARRRDRTKDQLSRCTCGCGKDVCEKTQRRHWKDLIAASKVDETTKGILRNASPAPSFPSTVTPARKRGGSRSPSPKPKRSKRRKTRVVSSESGDDAASDAPPAARDKQREEGDTTATLGSAADDIEQSEPVRDYSMDEGGTPSPPSPASAAAIPTTTPTPESDDARPALDSFDRQRYRATVEDVDDEEELSSDSASDGDDEDSDMVSYILPRSARHRRAGAM